MSFVRSRRFRCGCLPLMLFTLLPCGLRAAPRAGDPAPALDLERLLQAPDGASVSWDALRGNVVVLEFWATWCGPCITGLPLFNEKVQQFADRPVRFISISDEAPDVVQAFLGQRALEGWIGIDTDRSVFEGYGIGGIPTTIIVDPEGRVALRTSPRQITDSLLAALIEGRKVTLETPEAGSVPAVPDAVREAGVPAGNPLYNVSIVPVDIREHATKRGGKPAQDVQPTYLIAKGVTLRTLIEMAWDVPRSAIETGIAWGPQLFDVTAYAAGRPYAWRAALAGALVSTFELDVRRVAQPRQVLVLTAPRAAGPGLTPSSAGDHMSTGGGRLGMQNKSMDDLAQLVALSTRQRVINETGLAGNWNCELTWDRLRPESIYEEIEGQLGLRLERATRELDLLLVERAVGDL